MTTLPPSSLNALSRPAEAKDAVTHQTVEDFERGSGELVKQLGELQLKRYHDEPLGDNEIKSIQRINRALYPLLDRLETLGYVHMGTLQLNENDKLVFTA